MDGHMQCWNNRVLIKAQLILKLEKIIRRRGEEKLVCRPQPKTSVNSLRANIKSNQIRNRKHLAFRVMEFVFHFPWALENLKTCIAA